MLCWISYSVKPIQFNLQQSYHTNPAKPLLSIRNVHLVLDETSVREVPVRVCRGLFPTSVTNKTELIPETH